MTFAALPLSLFVIAGCSAFVMTGCSSSSSGGASPVDSGADGGAHVDEGGSDVSVVPPDAGGADAGGEGQAPLACSATFASCDSDGGGCCPGLMCLNQAYCCKSAGVVYGNCFTDSDCCSGHCDNGATGSSACCSGGGQLCDIAHSCCTGYQCGLTGTCCGAVGASCSAPGDCCGGTICGVGSLGGMQTPNTCCTPAVGSCLTDSDCCYDSPNCFGGVCCKSTQSPCTDGIECCSGTCASDGTCG